MPATKSYGYFMRSPDFSASKNTVDRNGALLRMVRDEKRARGALVEIRRHRGVILPGRQSASRLLPADCRRSRALISQFPEVFNHPGKLAASLDVRVWYLTHFRGGYDCRVYRGADQ